MAYDYDVTYVFINMNNGNRKRNKKRAKKRVMAYVKKGTEGKFAGIVLIKLWSAGY